MKTNDPWWWFSFCYAGRNTGVCIVQSPTKEEALQKTIDLSIHPKHDDISCYELDQDAEDATELELEPDRLYSREEMQALQYQPHNHR